MMKHIHMLTAVVAFLFTTTIVHAERIRVTSGDLSALKGVKKMNVEYDYSNMEVGKKTEKEYIADKKEAYNKKEPGRGDKWEKAWERDRQGRFEPRFEEAFNNVGDLRVGDFPKEKYTLIFKTVFTEPGYNIGIKRGNAYIDGEVWIVETANHNNIIAKLTCEDCPGRTFGGYDFDSGERIQEAYAMAGKGLAKYFVKNID